MCNADKMPAALFSIIFLFLGVLSSNPRICRTPWAIYRYTSYKGVVLKIRALRHAVSVETAISAKTSLLFPELLKAMTSVGLFSARYNKFNSVIWRSLTKQTVISPGIFLPSLDKALRTTSLIFFGLMGIFFCRFFMITFTVFTLRVGYAVMVNTA